LISQLGEGLEYCVEKMLFSKPDPYGRKKRKVVGWGRDYRRV